jgi:2-polyprenyl-6-methoxyphenol hydroxylase-like FAD-dependent oxidoreductase
MTTSPPRPGNGRRHDVVIRGAGIVGQTLALLLARERLKVALVAPPRPATGDDVRAYAISVLGREVLRMVRAWPDEPVPGHGDGPAPTVTPVSRMEVHGDRNGHVGFSAAEQGTDALAWIVDVPALERRLANAVHFQGGIDVLETEPEVPAALTVVCEGRRSRTRETLGIDYDTRPYPHMAIAARLACEHGHGGVARQWFTGREILALLPLGGPQGNSVALVWSVQTAQATRWLSSPPEALAAAVQERCGAALGAMHPLGPAQGWPLELARARRWVLVRGQGGVALAGDAAHAMHPLAGQGLNAGLADVAELARILREREPWRSVGDWRLLRRYERARQADIRLMSWLTDGLFGLFAFDDGRVQALRNWGMSGVHRLGPLKHWLARQAMGRAVAID